MFRQGGCKGRRRRTGRSKPDAGRFFLGLEKGRNLSVSHSLDSSPSRGALGKEILFSMKLIQVCWKT